MAPTKSTTVCRTFLHGGQCQWELSRSGCRFNHDEGLRDKILEKMKLAAAGPKKHNTPSCSSTGSQQLAANCASSTDMPTSTQLSTRSATTKTTSLRDGSLKPVSKPVIVVVQNDKAVSQALIAHAPQMTINSEKQCRFYVNGKTCPYINGRSGCRDVHDLDVRRANLASLAEKKLNKTKGNSGAQKKIPIVTPAPASHAIISAPSNHTSNSTKFHKHKSAEVKVKAQNTIGPRSSPRDRAEKAAALLADMKMKLSIVYGDTQFARTTASDSEAAIRKIVCSPAKIENSMTTIANTTPVSKSPSKVKPPTKPSPKWEPAHWLHFALDNIPNEESAKIIAPHIKDLDEGTASWKIFRTLPQVSTEGEFHYFPQLPYELRQQIWNYVQDDQRYEVRVQWLHEKDSYTEIIDGKEKTTEYIARSKFAPLNASPSLLHVNHESREIAKKTYELAFGTDSHPATTYFNFKWDLLFLNTRSYLELMDIPTQMSQYDRDNIRYLTISLKDYLSAGNAGKANEMTASLIQFIRLRVLTLLVGDGKEDALCRDDEIQLEKIQRHFITRFMASRPRRKKAPQVVMRKIDSWKAHLYRIDGLRW